MSSFLNGNLMPIGWGFLIFFALAYASVRFAERVREGVTS